MIFGFVDWATNKMSEEIKDKANLAAIQNALFEEITTEKIRLILEDDVITAAILICFDRTEDLDAKDASTVVNIITRKLLSKDMNGWYCDHFKSIANAIIEIFPCEVIGTYFVPTSGKGCRGKIADSFKI